MSRSRRAASAATLLVVITAMAGGAWWIRQRVLALNAATRELEARLAASRDTLEMLRGPHVRSLIVSVTTGGRFGTVMLLEDTLRNRWLVRCENLAPNEPGEEYRLWFVTDNGMRNAATMTLDRAETVVALLHVPDDAPRVIGAAMSIEPRAGATGMSGPVVFREML